MKKQISRLDRYLATNFGYGTRSFSTKELIIFSEKLLAQIKRHLTIPEALETIYQSTGERTLRMILMGMSTNVASGTPLSQSMLTFKDVFPNYYIAAIMATERSGKIVEGMEALINLLKNEKNIAEYTGLIGLYSKVFVYNIFIAMGILLFFQIGIISLTVNSILYTMGALIGIVLFITMIAQYITADSRKESLEKIIFKLPSIGRLYLLIKISRFCYLFHTFQKSGLPFLQNVELQGNYIDCYVCRKDLSLIYSGLKSNEPAEGIIKALARFPEQLAKELFLFKTGDTKVDSIRNYSFYISDEISEIALALISRFKTIFVWSSIFILGWVYLLFMLKL